MLFSELDKELLLSKITSSTSLKVYVFDMDEEQVVYTNNSIVESLGYTREQVKTFGKNVKTSNQIQTQIKTKKWIALNFCLLAISIAKIKIIIQDVIKKNCNKFIYF